MSAEMRYAILADIHGNLVAFETVLGDLERRGGVEEIWCLGDIVGYGPDPEPCIELLRQHPHLCVAGNHDWAAAGKIDISYFNPEAAAACSWTAGQLSPGARHYLESLPTIICRDDFTLVHGSPREPIWEYILSVATARANFACFESKFCLIGHSHVPLVFGYVEGGGNCLVDRLSVDSALQLRENRSIINPGGVGQPRDGDPRASYAIYDTEARAVYHYRIPYDIAATQRRMMELELPLSLAARLSYGL